LSYKVVELVLDHAPVTDARTMLLLVALAEWSKDDGVTWHGIPAMMRRARCARRTVETILKSLLDPDAHGRTLLFKRPGQNKVFYEINLPLLRRLRAEQKGQGNLFESCAPPCKTEAPAQPAAQENAAECAPEAQPTAPESAAGCAHITVREPAVEPEVEPELKPQAVVEGPQLAAAAVDKLVRNTSWPGSGIEIVRDEQASKKRDQLLKQFYEHQARAKA